MASSERAVRLQRQRHAGTALRPYTPFARIHMKRKGAPTDTDGQRLQHLDHAEWLLKRPDAFIGRVEPCEFPVTMFHHDVEEGTMAARHATVHTSPALLTLFKELTTNALDNARRDPAQRFIRIRIDRASGLLEVSNDGDTLPIEPFNGDTPLRLTPSVAFSEFLTSTNYNDDEERLGAGRNGVGAKGCNVYAAQFTVDIVHGGKSFSQTWRSNMTDIGQPSVKSSRVKTSRTTVQWLPDYPRLGLPHVPTGGLADDEYSSLCSIAYQTSVCAPAKVSVFLNDRKLTLRSLEHVVRAFGAPAPLASDTVTVAPTGAGDDGVRMGICVGASPNPMEGNGRFIAFVNGVSCCEGTHAKWVLDKVRAAVMSKVKRRGRDADVSVKPAALQAEMVVACSLTIDRPRFNNQQKTELASAVREFGFSWAPSDRFLAQIARSELPGRAADISRASADRQLEKAVKVRAKVSTIPKYQSAEKLRDKASLIICEGDSALNFAVAGLGVVGRRNFGVFPIRGKLLNARNAGAKRLMENAEIKNLTAILGLELGHVYSSCDRLNYKHLVILSDMDPDGSHIRGLLINFLNALFPSLLHAFPDYIRCFATPLVRVDVGGGHFHTFFNECEFKTWREARVAAGQSCGSARYYKGLGALSNSLAKTFFSAMDAYTVTLTYSGARCDERLSLYFDEKRVADRKLFLGGEYDSDAQFDFSAESAPISQWCDRDLVHFCMYNNTRMFPSVVDGLKPSQRKVLHACFKMNLTKDMKVFQLVGRVAADTAYHHGDASLTGCITGMAAEYTGANNISLLWPEGQFGSANSHAAASSRYISTRLDPIADRLFRPEDRAVLTYLEDDGAPIEPTFFVPLLPMVLLNGCEGIGSGWSTSCPMFDPARVLDYVLAYLDRRFDGRGGPLPELKPWYRGFHGTIERTDGGDYLSKGVFDVRGNDVHVTELPIGAKETNEWIEDAKRRLTADGKFATDVLQKSSTWRKHVVLTSTASRLAGVDLDVELRLEKRILLSNIHLWSASGQLKRYTVEEIVEEHANERLRVYELRLRHLIDVCRTELFLAASKRSYIERVRSREIDVTVEKKVDLESALEALGFERVKGSYNYLIGMPTYSLTADELSKLQAQEDALATRLQELNATLPVSLWRKELEELRAALREYDGRAQEARP